MTGSDHITLRFDTFELDSSSFELRADGKPVHVEPQVIALLLLLAANPHRLVSKDELVEKIWDGRIVSEAAISARIKHARKAIGDDGSQQRLIRTVHGKGFRFVGKVTFVPVVRAAPVTALDSAAPETLPSDDPRQGRPAIAVLPFRQLGAAGPHDIAADALPAEIIMDLSRLPWLFVIARGSSFRLRGTEDDSLGVGRTLGVRYCLSGTMERVGPEFHITVTLAETDAGGVIWAERYRGPMEELQQLRAEIVRKVVESLSHRIQQHEISLARGRPVCGLDAWSAFHLGLDHMFRFNRADNALAAQYFGQAVSRDGNFASALGGLSFTHFQNAFLRYGADPGEEAEQARLLANRAVECDRLDPFASFNLARSFWLEGRLSDSIEWFDRATAISPNYAQGIYNRGLVATLAGDAVRADKDLATALELSPIDPLRYAMLSSRALTHLQFGELEQAAEFAERAALTPGAHKHIQLIAALTAHIAGDEATARLWLGRSLKSDPAQNVETFFKAFPFAPIPARDVVERGLRDLGL